MNFLLWTWLLAVGCIAVVLSQLRVAEGERQNKSEKQLLFFFKRTSSRLKTGIHFFVFCANVVALVATVATSAGTNVKRLVFFFFPFN